MESGSYVTFGGAAKASYQLYDGLSKIKGLKVDAMGEYSKMGKDVKAIAVDELMQIDYDIIFMNSIRDIIYVDPYVKAHPKTTVVYVDRSNTLLNYRSQGLIGLPPDLMVSFLALKPVEKLFSEEILKLSFRKWKTHMTEKQTRSTKFLSSAAVAGGDVVKRYLVRRMKRWLDVYVAIIPEQEAYAKRLFRGKVKVEYIPIAPDTEFRKLSTKRRFYGALYVGRLEERQKRLTFLINAIANVRLRHPEIAEQPLLRIVGSGPHKHRYVEMVERLRLGRNIEFIGNTTGERLVKLYNDASFFVSPSIWESPGRTVMEAMSCGLPVLLNSKNNVIISENPRKHIVTDSYDGLIYDYGDTTDFTDKFYKLYMDSSLRNRLAKNAYNSSKEFSLKNVIGSFRKLVDAI